MFFSYLHICFPIPPNAHLLLLFLANLPHRNPNPPTIISTKALTSGQSFPHSPPQNPNRRQKELNQTTDEERRLQQTSLYHLPELKHHHQPEIIMVEFLVLQWCWCNTATAAMLSVWACYVAERDKILFKICN